MHRLGILKSNHLEFTSCEAAIKQQRLSNLTRLESWNCHETLDKLPNEMLKRDDKSHR